MAKIPEEVLAMFAAETREMLQATKNALAHDPDERTLQGILAELWTLRGNAEALQLEAIATAVRTAQAEFRVAPVGEWHKRLDGFLRTMAGEFRRLGWDARLNGVVYLNPPEERSLEVFLHPGNLYFSKSAAVVKTILGSCVAVCIYDERLRMGGVNHYLLPFFQDEASPKYGDVAIPALISRFIEAAGRLKDLRASVYGGASVIQAVSKADDSVGAKNVRLAREILATNGIPIVAEDVGGTQGRKLIFNPQTGEAQAHRI